MKPIIGIVLAAGSSLRMRSEKVKPLIEIGGKTIVEHSLTVLENCDALHGYILVVEKSKIKSYRDHLLGQGSVFRRLLDIVSGGSTRQESVYSGLMTLDETTEAVLIHDVARPCVDKNTLEASIHGCSQYDAVISAIPSADTMKIVNDGVVKVTPDRSTVWGAQTPQTFRYKVLRTAHEQAQKDSFVGTDDAELVERAGYMVRVLKGSPDNIKVTVPEDLDIAEHILRRQGRI